MNEQLPPAKRGRPHGCLVVLVTGLGGALIAAGFSYLTYDPCVPDPDVAFDCLFDTRGFNAFFAGLLGLFVGVCAGLLLLPFWPRVVRDKQRADGDALAWSFFFFIVTWLGTLVIDVSGWIAFIASLVAAVAIYQFVRRRGGREVPADETE